MFTQLAFRPDSFIAKIWTGLTIVILSATIPVMFALGQLANQTHPIAMGVSLWTTSGFAWTFWECTSYYLRMRRQARIGLGDPVIQNRFLLWSVWTGSFVVLPIVTFTTKVVLLANTAPGEEVVAPVGVTNFINAVVLVCFASMLISIWLSFFAPESYLDRIRGDAKTS